MLLVPELKILFSLALPDGVSEKKLGEVMKGVEYRLEAHAELSQFVF